MSGFKALIFFLTVSVIIGVTGNSCLAAEKTYRIKLATLAPEGSIWVKELQKCKEELEKATDGRVELKLYPGGIMGDDPVILRKIRVGQLDGGIFTSNALCMIYPDFRVFSLPYLFNNTDEIDYIIREMKIELAASFNKGKYEMLGLTGIGFTYMFSQKPIESVKDLRKAKSWLWTNDPVMTALYVAADATPVALGIGDVMTALQTGLLNTVFNTPAGILALQWFTKVDVMTDLPLNYSLGAFIISSRTWKKLPEDLQKIVAEVIGHKMTEINIKTREEDKRAVEIISQRGVNIMPATEQWKQDTIVIAERAKENLIRKEISSEMIARIESLLQTYRNQ